MKKKMKNKNAKNIKRTKFKNITIKLKEKVKKVEWIGVISLILAIISIFIDLQIRQDTAEITKLSDKSLYYTIRLFPTNDMYEYEDHDKYVRLKFCLAVDDFEIEKKGFFDVNYNSSFTRVKYYMVYDYELGETNKYKYMLSEMDDKSQAMIRLENYEVTVSEMNYSMTPNKNFAYALIYTEGVNQKNLDMILFEFNNTGNSFGVTWVENENGDIEIEHEIINKDTYICKDYFEDLWSEGDTSKKEDLKFMFDVYNDLYNKII